MNDNNKINKSNSNLILFEIEKTLFYSRHVLSIYPRLVPVLTNSCFEDEIHYIFYNFGFATYNKQSSLDFQRKIENKRLLEGIKKCLEYVNSSNKNIVLDINLIKKFHQILLSNTNYLNIGEFRSSDSLDINMSSTKIKSILYKETHLSLEKQANDLIEDFNQNLVNKKQNILIKILELIFRLCKLELFENFNALVIYFLFLYLFKNYVSDLIMYESLQKSIYLNKTKYFGTLYAKNASLNIDNLIDISLNILYDNFTNFRLRYNICNGKKMLKNDRIKNCFYITNDSLNKKDIQTLWPDISYNAIEAELSLLLKDKIISKSGVTNGVSYTLTLK